MGMKAKIGDVIVFRGCIFDDQWEFDAPCIVYAPVKRYGIGGNSGKIDDLVEDICFDLSSGKDVQRGFSKFNLQEFKWRGWSPRGFARRRAWHVEIKVKFVLDEYKMLSWKVIGRKEKWRNHGFHNQTT